MSVRKTPKGWRVDWRSADGRRHRKTFRTQKAADAHERKMIDERELGILPTGTRSDHVKDFLVTWERAVYPSIRTNTMRGYESAVRRYVLPRLGDMRLRDVDQRVVQDYVSDLTAEGLSPRTVEFQFAVLSSILNLAADYGLAKPAHKAKRGGAGSGIRLPKKVRAHRSPPTVAQIELLATKIDPDCAALVRLAGYCGLRQSECFGLSPASVDLERHRVHVRRTLEHASRSLVDLTKNGHDRYVTLVGPAAESLADHLAEYAGEDLVFHRRGRPIHPSVFHRWVWHPARCAAGLPDVWFHDLRHSAASIMAAGGWGPKKVQAELGHHSASFTLDRYSHLWAEDQESARLSLNEALAAQIAKAKLEDGRIRS